MHMGHVNEWLRTKATYVLAGICVILMVVWIVPWQNLTARERFEGGQVFGQPVNGNDVWVVSQTLSLLIPTDKRPSQDKVMAQAWETVILGMEAKRYGVEATDADVAKVLSARFGFSDDAAANEKFLAQFLGRSGLTTQQFQNGLKQLITTVMLLGTIRNSVVLTDSEAWLWYCRENEKIKAKYVQLQAQDLAPLVTLDDAKVAAFYEKYKEIAPDAATGGIGYLKPERVKIEYLMVPFSQFASKAVVTQRQIEEYYEANKQQFKKNPPDQPEKPGETVEYRPLADVTPRIEATLRRDEATRAATELIRDVRGEALKQMEVPWGSREARSADFAAVAKTFTEKNYVVEDKQSKDFFSADEINTVIPGAFDLETKAFGKSALARNVPSAAMTAGNGMYIFQIIDNQPPAPASFNEIKAKVTQDYRMQQAFNAATEMAAAARKARNFDAATAIVEKSISELIAKATPPEGQEIKKDPKAYYKAGETAFFDRPRQFFGQLYQFSQIDLPAPGRHAEFSQAAFALKPGEIGTADETTEAKVVYLLERSGEQPASQEEFTKQRDQVNQMLLAQKQQAAEKSWMEDLRRRAKPSAKVMDYLKLLDEWQES